MKTFLKLLVALGFAALGNFDSYAASHTWSGAINGLWSLPANWSAGGAPTNGETALNLTFPPGGRSINTNDITGLHVDSWALSGSGYMIYALVGKTLTLNGTATNIVCGGLNTLDASMGLILSNTNFISVATNQTLTVNGPISGNGSLGKVGPGQLQLTGASTNTYTGATFAFDGGLTLQRGASVNSPAIAVPGALVVGNPAVSNSQASVNVNFPEQIADSSPVSVYNSAELSINGYTETIGPLDLHYGNVGSLGAGSLLKLNGDVTAMGSAPGQSIMCPLSLGGVTRTFNVSAGNFDLAIFSSIADGGNNAGIIKAGGGVLRLAASNSYSGITLVSAGCLSIGDGHALGSTNGGTVITNTAMLRFLESFSVGAEPLTLASLPLLGYALYDDIYTNSWAGPVTLVSNAVVDLLMSNCSVTFSGPISGPGGLIKQGYGTLTLSGTNANTYAGATTVSGGTLVLTKTSGTISIPGALIIGNNVAQTNTEVVQSQSPNQIADTASVTVMSSGLLNLSWFFGASDTIGSLSGSGDVFLGLNTLTVGDSNDSTFAGTFSSFPAANIVKQGTGTLTLNGDSSAFQGTVIVNLGKLVVNGSLGGPLQMNFLSSLGGTGTVGNVTATLGHIAPGNSVGKITTGNLTLNNGSSSLDVQLNGNTPGTGYDQLAANGTVALSNPGLNIAMGFPGAVGNKYVIIANDGADAVSGTFNGLAEGASFASGGVQFQISYHGGDGNDVELTQLSLSVPSSQINNITRLPNGQIQLSGTGSAGMNYSIEANTNISTTNWVGIGSVMADQNGAIGFTDPNAPSFPTRFYRFKLQ